MTQRQLDQEQERIRRDLKRVRDEDLVDLVSKMDNAQTLIDNLISFKAAAEPLLSESKTAQVDDEKLILIANEMQNLKNQIYFIQQSILQIRTRSTTTTPSVRQHGTKDEGRAARGQI